MAATVDSHECREKERTLQLPLISSYPFTLVTMGLCSGLGFGDGCIVSSTDPGPGPTGIYAYGGMSYEWAEMWLGLDARYTCNTDCTLSTYCDAEDGSGQFFARRVEWRAHISGLAAYDTSTFVYFHIEGRTIGSGSWSEVLEIIVQAVADANGNYITPWVFVPFETGTNTYEYRLQVGSEVSFSSTLGGP